MKVYRHKVVDLKKAGVVGQVGDTFKGYGKGKLKPQLNDDKLVKLLDEESQNGWELAVPIEFMTEWWYSDGKSYSTGFMSSEYKYQTRKPFSLGIPLKIVFRQEVLKEHPHR